MSEPMFAQDAVASICWPNRSARRSRWAERPGCRRSVRGYFWYPRMQRIHRFPLDRFRDTTSDATTTNPRDVMPAYHGPTTRRKPSPRIWPSRSPMISSTSIAPRHDHADHRRPVKRVDNMTWHGAGSARAFPRPSAGGTCGGHAGRIKTASEGKHVLKTIARAWSPTR